MEQQCDCLPHPSGGPPVWDYQAGTSLQSYLHCSCDSVGMTLYNSIPHFSVPQLQKGESTAISSLPHSQNLHLAWQQKRFGFDYSSISDVLAPEKCDCSHCSYKQSSKFSKSTSVLCKFFNATETVQLQYELNWASGRIRAPEFHCYLQPSISNPTWGASPWLVCNRQSLCPDKPVDTEAILHALQSSLTCYITPWHSFSEILTYWILQSLLQLLSINISTLQITMW